MIRCFAKKKSLHESCRMGRRIEADSLICLIGHCECNGHTVHKLSQRRLTADLLDPRVSDCSRIRSNVSSDWLPSYIKATPPVLETFKLAKYFPDRPLTEEVSHISRNSKTKHYVQYSVPLFAVVSLVDLSPQRHTPFTYDQF